MKGFNADLVELLAEELGKPQEEVLADLQDAERHGAFI